MIPFVHTRVVCSDVTLRSFFYLHGVVVGQNGPLFRALVKLSLVKMERPWRPLVKVVKMGGGTRQYGSAHMDMLAKALLYSMWVST